MVQYESKQCILFIGVGQVTWSSFYKKWVYSRAEDNRGSQLGGYCGETYWPCDGETLHSFILNAGMAKKYGFDLGQVADQPSDGEKPQRFALAFTKTDPFKWVSSQSGFPTLIPIDCNTLVQEAFDTCWITICPVIPSL